MTTTYRVQLDGRYFVVDADADGHPVRVASTDWFVQTPASSLDAHLITALKRQVRQAMWERGILLWAHDIATGMWFTCEPDGTPDERWFIRPGPPTARLYRYEVGLHQFSGTLEECKETAQRRQ